VKYGIDGKFEEAKGQFEKARKIDPFCETVKALLKITEDVMDQKIKPITAVHLFKGICCCEKRQWDDAVAEFNTAIKLNPMCAYTYTWRGGSYLSKDQYDKAISDFNKAIKINPKFPMAYQNRALVYFFKSEYNKGWKDFIKLQALGCQMHPKFIKALCEASYKQR